ncbi:N-acetylmuramoyl-L-alanine amidase family protein [Paenibacillus phocaensis]|uniref:N-acetylmuramoyl-L-alanine amidase family protein n=1 Tax=Paenibacillus phocaensis TaxID=1776378 RepID=UPI00039A0046|nr:N-acetylmuramoyl-L-alanine amidase [Paenibacillus phocaensis]
MRKITRCLIALVMSIALVPGIGIPPASADGGKDLRHAFPEPVILIDAGHGGIDGGTSYEQILEKDINLEIGRRLYVVLRSHGYRAILNRTGDYALSDDNRWLQSRSRHMRDLAQRKELSEQLPASIVVSLHVNWGRNNTKRGPLVLHQNEGRSAVLAAAIQQSLERFYQQGTTRLPELGKPFYLLNHIDCPAVIVEMGFLSNAEDRAILTNRRGQQRIAEALYRGIAEYFTVM